MYGYGINICWLNHLPLPTAIGWPKWWRNGSGQHLLNVKNGACASYTPTSHHWSSRGLRRRNIPQTHWQTKRLDILSPTWRLQPMPVCIAIWHNKSEKNCVELVIIHPQCECKNYQKLIPSKASIKKHVVWSHSETILALNIECTNTSWFQFFKSCKFDD